MAVCLVVTKATAQAAQAEQRLILRHYSTLEHSLFAAFNTP